MMGRCLHRWSPPAPPHPAWLFCTVTSEKLNSEKTLSVLPCCVRRLASLQSFRVEFQDISDFVLSGAPLTQTQELTFKGCVSVPSFQKHFPAPFNPEKTSHSPHGVWQTPPWRQTSRRQKKSLVFLLGKIFFLEFLLQPSRREHGTRVGNK